MIASHLPPPLHRLKDILWKLTMRYISTNISVIASWLYLYGKSCAWYFEAMSLIITYFSHRNVTISMSATTRAASLISHYYFSLFSFYKWFNIVAHFKYCYLVPIASGPSSFILAPHFQNYFVISMIAPRVFSLHISHYVSLTASMRFIILKSSNDAWEFRKSMTHSRENFRPQNAAMISSAMPPSK